ncbi:hypothetical protein D3C81_1127150 [compost metagenome]
MAGVDHYRRSQKDRYHVSHRFTAYALPRRCRCAADAYTAGSAEHEVPSSRSLQRCIYNSRYDHDSLHGDAADVRLVQPGCTFTAGRKGRSLSVPELDELLAVPHGSYAV